MSIDTRTPSEIAYDAQRNGTLYDLPISADEQAICTWIMQQTACDVPEDTDTITAILEAIDGGERRQIDERFDRCIDAVSELPDAQRAHAIALWEGFLAGCAAA